MCTLIDTVERKGSEFEVNKTQRLRKLAEIIIYQVDVDSPFFADRRPPPPTILKPTPVHSFNKHKPPVRYCWF